MVKFKTKHKELPKEELERKKLTSEIRSLKFFWLAPTFSLAVAIIAAVIGWWAGFFDTSMKAIKIERYNLERFKDSIEVQKNKMFKDLKKMQYKLDSTTHNYDSVCQLKDYYEKNFTNASNQLNITRNIVENQDSIIALNNKELEKWKQSKQPPLELKKEVLSFVKEIRFLISFYDRFQDTLLTDKSEPPRMRHISNPVCRIYHYSFQSRAGLYRSKIDFILKNSDIEELDNNQAQAIYGDPTPDVSYIKFMADDLESMANKITD